MAVDSTAGTKVTPESFCNGHGVTRRTFLAGSAACAAGLALAGCNAAGTQEDEGKADLVLKNGVVQTMDSEDSVASAVASKDGKIVFVGSNEGVEKYVGDSTKVIDLEGAYVLPGFIDGHNHGSDQQLQKKYNLYLKETEPNVGAYHEVMKKFVEDHPDMEYVPGLGLNLNAFDGFPTSAFIDEVMADKIVWINDMSQHGCLLNARALEAAGITKDTPDPAGGKIIRDTEGNPTGYLSDCFSLTDVLKEHFSYTDEQVYAAFKEFEAEMNSYGITAFQMAGGASDKVWKMVNDLEKSGELSMRVSAGPFVNFSEDDVPEAVKSLDDAQKYNSDWQKTMLIKALLDGVPEGATAALSEPYTEAAGMGAGYCGPAYTDQETLNKVVAIADKAGYQVELHAMGDEAVHMSLDAFEYAQKENGKRDARHQIAHATLMRDEDIQRMADLEVIGAMQPMWFYYDPFFSYMEEANFGPERFAKEYRVKTMLDAGIVMTGSVDYPITLEVRPLTGIQAGATQQSPFDEGENDPKTLRNPNEAVSVMDMIKFYTTNGAKALFMEDKIGSIEKDKLADMVVLGQNLTEVDVRQVANTGVLYTISGGRVVYEGGDKTVAALPIQ